MAHANTQERSSCGPTFTDLPPEILARVGGFCSAQQLQNLRQASRLLETSTYESWRQCRHHRISIAVTKKEIDRHLGLLSTNPTLGRVIQHLRLVFPAIMSRYNMTVTTSCILRLKHVLQWLPHINIVEIHNWNGSLPFHWWTDPLVPTLPRLWRLFSGYNLDSISLVYGFFFARDVPILLRTLKPRALHICASTFEKSPPSRAALNERFNFVVTGPSHRRDVGQIYEHALPNSKFRGEMQLDNANEQMRYTMFATARHWSHQLNYSVWGTITVE